MSLELPPELEPYRAALEASVKPCVVLEKAEGEPGLRDSKVGGVPYWPKGMEYPRSSSGEPLYLLAQLNLDDLPKLEGFPQTGLLQFFISGVEPFYGPLFGMDFDNPESGVGHRVVYHSSVNLENQTLEQETLGTISAQDYTLPFKPTSVYRLSGRITLQPVSASDRVFEAILGVDPEDNQPRAWFISAPYEQMYPANGHRLGGYPYFTQTDPRTSDSEHILLFQLDTDDDLEVMWGDCGVGNFFIRAEDIERLDFSRVFYSWDCS